MSQAKERKENNGKRAATVLAVLFVFALLFSLVFLFAESDHDCTGGDCAVCRMLCLVKDIFGKRAFACGIAAAVIFSVRKFNLVFSSVKAFFLSTLVALKVKLSA